MSLLIATSPTLTSSSGIVSRMKASGTPRTPVVANVAMTAPATTVIGADADTPSTDSPGEPRLFRASPWGEEGRVTALTPPHEAARTVRSRVLDVPVAMHAASRRPRAAGRRGLARSVPFRLVR